MVAHRLTGVRSKVWSVSDEEFRFLVSCNLSYSSILRSFGLSTRGGCSLKALKKRIKELCCDISHFQHTGAYKKSYTSSEMLCENSSYTNLSSLKKRLIKEGWLDYSCSICVNSGTWQDKPLILHLDHINGIHTDHTLTNLRFLCPNCHSQTETYSGKNKNKSKRQS